MSLDWSILHWIQSTLTCPALDLLMPKITLLGNGGMIWLLASGGLICTKKYRKQGVVLLGIDRITSLSLLSQWIAGFRWMVGVSGFEL